MEIIGCDVAKESFDVAYLSGQRWTAKQSFPNRAGGFRTFLAWLSRQCGCPRKQLCVAMEATGVYHLPLAAYLTKHDVSVLVANPGRSHAFAESQGQLNKTDPLDARSLQRYGTSLDLSEQHLFQVDAKEISRLKALLSRVEQLDKDVQREQNRLEKCPFIAQSAPLAQSIKRQIGRLRVERQRIDGQIKSVVENDPLLDQNSKLLQSIKGIGEKTARWLLPLLHRQRFRDARQLAAFLGITPCHRISGKDRRPGQLSGRGSRRIRSKLYMPAVTAITHDPVMKRFYEERIRRGAKPKQALVAVMRKLVHFAYGVVKNQIPYQPGYNH